MDQDCCICGEPLDGENVARCHSCGGYFHMGWSVDAQMKNCGHYWLNEISCGLAFACDLCQQGLSARENQSPNQSSTAWGI